MLGHIAVDRITGLKGIITAVADFLHSPQRIELSPEKLHEGAPVKGVWLDVPRLLIGKSKIKAPKFESTVTMGDKVTDNLTGFKGVAVGRFTFLNGCIRIEVASKTLKDGKPVEPEVFDEQRLTGKISEQKPGGPRPGPTPYSTCKH